MDRPLSESLQKLRRAQRALVRRKRGSRVRVSFSHVSSGRPVAVAAADVVNIANPEKPKVERPCNDPRQETVKDSKPSRQKQGSPLPRARAGERLDEYHAFIRNGHCLSSPVKHKHAVDRKDRAEQDDRFSLMQVADHATVKTEGRRAGGRRPEYAHAAPLEAHPLRRGPHQNGAQPIVILPPSMSRRTSPSRQHRPRRNTLLTTEPKPGPPITPPMRTANMKRFALRDPVVMESIRRSLSQQRRLSSLAVSEGKATGPRSPRGQPPSMVPETVESSAPSSNVNGASRSSSQQRALDKFTRELEKFAKASGIAGQIPVFTPTATNTPVSLETIKELLPYRDQFLASGLAVTSTDQKSPCKVDKPRAPKYDGARPARLNLDGGTASSQTSLSTGNSNDTMVRFLPPNRLSLALADQVPDKKKPQEILKIAKSKRTTRSIIPWLRRKSPVKPIRPPSKEVTFQLRRSTVLSVDKPLPQRPVPSRPPPKPPGEVQTERTIWTGGEKCLPPLPRRSQASGFQRGTPQNGSQPSQAKVPKVTTTVREESEASPAHPPSQENHDHQKRDNQLNNANKTTRSSTKTSPVLPETWKFEGGSPSSFERALDDVVRKLDDMEERRLAGEAVRSENPSPSDTTRQSLKKPTTPAERLQRASQLRRMKIGDAEPESSRAATQSSQATTTTTSVTTSGTVPEGSRVKTASRGSNHASSGTSKALSVFPRKGNDAIRNVPSETPTSSVSAKDVMVDHEDRDISDRDILRGLRLAISAACDEDLDTWIRTKTGLRLRRFLADLKTFETLQEQRPLGKRAERA